MTLAPKYDSKAGVLGQLRRVLGTLTVEVLPLGRDELLGGGLAHGLGQALAGDGVFGGEDAVVYRLAARHVEGRAARAVANSSSCSFLPA